MTIHVNIGEAKTRLSELVAAAVRGEEVVLAKAGVPQARLVPMAERSEEQRARIAAGRRAAFGMWRGSAGGRDIDVRSLRMSDAERDERDGARFGPAD